MRLRVGVAVAVAVVFVVTDALAASASASSTSAPALCAPASLHRSEAIATASQGWGPLTLFLGSVRFTNTGPTCVLPSGRVSLRAELGVGQRHWPVGTASAGWFSQRLVLRHGATASVFARVDAVPPKNWRSGTPCAPALFAGVLVRGPAPRWVRFVPLYPNPDFCSAYHLTTSAGVLQLGS